MCLKDFDAKLDKICKWNDPELTPPALRHTTNFCAALAISTSGIFRHMVHTSTKDSKELKAVEPLLEPAIQSVLSELENKGLQNTVAYEVLAGCPPDFGKRMIGELRKAYLACFSTSEPEKIWRSAHGKGDNAFCLTLNRSLSDSIEYPKGVFSELAPVRYNPKLLQKRLTNRFRKVGSLIALECSSSAKKEGSPLARAAIFRIAASASVFSKIPDFAWENEWRQVVFTDPNLAHSYVELPLAVESIHIRPDFDKVLAREFQQRVEASCLEKGLQCPTIELP